MALFKKKVVPSELPNLALDDLESGNNEIHEHLKKEETVSMQPQPVVEAEVPVQPIVSEAKTEVQIGELPKETVSSVEEASQEEIATEASEKNSNSVVEGEIPLTGDEKSFFKDLHMNLNEELSDFSEFENP